jgi:sulfate adenylyltransferase
MERAAGLVALTLSPESEADLTLLASGALSPLDRFLDREGYEHSLEGLQTADGAFCPLPVTLPLPVEEAGRVELDREVALVNRRGELLAVLRVEEVFAARPRREGAAGLESVTAPWRIAGRPRVVGSPRGAGWSRFHPTPAQSRECLERFDHGAVLALALQEPAAAGLARSPAEAGPARGYPGEELALRIAGELGAVVLFQPQLPPGEVAAGFDALAERHRGRAVVALLPRPGQARGSRAVLRRALLHRNHGADHLLLGEAEAEAAAELLLHHGIDLGLAMVTGPQETRS